MQRSAHSSSRADHYHNRNPIQFLCLEIALGSAAALAAAASRAGGRINYQAGWLLAWLLEAF